MLRRTCISDTIDPFCRKQFSSTPFCDCFLEGFGCLCDQSGWRTSSCGFIINFMIVQIKQVWVNKILRNKRDEKLIKSKIIQFIKLLVARIVGFLNVSGSVIEVKQNLFPNDLQQLIKLTLMNRTNRTTLSAKKTNSLNFAPTIIKCSPIIGVSPLKNPVSTSSLTRVSDVPLDSSTNLKLSKNDSIQQQPLQELRDEEMHTLGLRLRKNIYRSRKEKKGVFSKPKVSAKSKIFDDNRLYLYYRNQIISLISLLGKRQYLFNLFKGKKIGVELMPIKNYEIEEKFKTVLAGRGRDITRKNFNHITNEQLRCLKYRAKPLPVLKKDNKGKGDDEQGFDSDEGENEEQQEQNYGDLATWKRKNGVYQNQKIFIVKGGYHELRSTLVEKGWAENEDVWSQFYDFKWTTKTIDIDFGKLKSGQCVNHFNNNHHLTSKYGLARRLRTLLISHNVDIDLFYPRCYDLGDQTDFQNFVQNFKFSFAESVGKRFLIDKERYKNRQLKIRYVRKILQNRALSFSERVNLINNGEFLLIFPDEWEIITETDEFTEQEKAEKLEQLRKSQGANSAQSEENIFETLHNQIADLLGKIEQKQPQLAINGHRNVWIAKPNFLSRGRGIRCFNNLYDIADYCLGRDCQFVIQKYIQNPLLIEGKKFDIRQWVLIQDYNPPKIYFYEQCYLRFCMDDYSLDNIQNRFIHLTNNSIQKHNKAKKGMIDESMWEMDRFAAHIGPEKWKVIQEKIKNIVVWSIKSCEGHVTGKKGSCEMVGFDFMIDDMLNPWLIEINMSPSMDNSTPVASKLVKMVQRDTAMLIASNKIKKKVGKYSLIYEGEKDLESFSQYCCKQ